jgi:cupin fold WbuC family metalloprotein
MSFIRQSDEVYVSETDVTTVTGDDIAFLKARAAENPRRRVRLCAHRDTADRLHEMLIVHMRGTYVQPHKHLGKSESFHVIEGRLKVLLFDDDGRHTRTVQLSEPNGGASFFYRLAAPTFHSVVPESEFVVFHEVTNGPFDRRETIAAPWAPSETDAAAGARFLAGIVGEQR